jgi:dienelactone hydrolase/predicted Ser/Thr protein kinase
MIGQTISHYRITEKLGEGGMGVVYKAEDTKLKRPVALKFLRPEALDDKERQDRFLHEAQAAAALNHPNVCVVYEIDETDGSTFIVMEFIEGDSVKDKVAVRPLKLDEALAVAIQVGEALKVAHAKGVVHRDIKSANIMVTAEGLGKVMDFGLAQLSGRTRLTKTGSSLGTPAYMSPEQALGKEVDHRSDIWSFAVVLYEMTSGLLPFKGEVEAAVAYSIVNGEPEPLTSLRVGVPVELDRVLAKALAKDPNERYQHVDEVLVDLRAILRDLEVRQKPYPHRESVGTAATPTVTAGPERASAEAAVPARRVRSRSAITTATFVTIAVVGLAAWWVARNARIGEVRQMLPEISRLADDQQFVAAYRMAEEAEQVLGGDPALLQLWPKVSRSVSVRTEPTGADVYVREYADSEGDWRHLGQTPVEGVRIPLQYSRWRIEKDGYEEIEVADRWDVRLEWRVDDFDFTLLSKGTSPMGMVRIKGSALFGPYYIDRYEVTNRQFKEFVDDGGYGKREYWSQEFVSSGRTLSWDEVAAEFRDSTGRPGPATWSLGTYPDGEDAFPVGGVSWYEATAYAEWADKELPTLYHWQWAADGASNHMVPVSFIEVEEPGRVGSSQAISAWGVYDLAGNVREWSLTSFEDQRLILGGAWNQPSYVFGDVRGAHPLDRSAVNGFRCAKYLEPLSENAALPVDLELRDYSRETPVDDETFGIYRSLLSYDRGALDEKVESVDDTAEHWIKEKVSFDAAYAGERVTAYLFLPRGTDPPYQVVVYFPGSGAEMRPSSEHLAGIPRIEPIIRSGRAVLYPVYKGTYERRPGGQQFLGLSLFGDTVSPTARRDVAIMATRDLSRSVDYLESRSDIQADRIGYMGFSLGARMGALCLANEKRIVAGILVHGGLFLAPKSIRLPEVDEINYAPRVGQPVLMLNGRFDFVFSVERSQIPLFELLGTPPSDKKHVLFDGGHGAFLTNDQIRESLDWLDRYLGPVN